MFVFGYIAYDAVCYALRILPQISLRKDRERFRELCRKLGTQADLSEGIMFSGNMIEVLHGKELGCAGKFDLQFLGVYCQRLHKPQESNEQQERPYSSRHDSHLLL